MLTNFINLVFTIRKKSSFSNKNRESPLMSISKLFLKFFSIYCLSICYLNAEGSKQEILSIESEIREFILENPEIIIESLRNYEKRMSELSTITEKKLIAANLQNLIDDRFSYSTGDKENSINVVAFIDYKCGFCKKSLQEMTTLISNNSRVRFIIKEFPILGAESLLASKASIALFINQGPEIYEAFVRYLTEYNGSISLKKIKQIIDIIGANSDNLESLMEKEIVYNVLNSNYALANILKITGTPTFIIGSEIIRGYKDQKELQKIIQRNYSAL